MLRITEQSRLASQDVRALWHGCISLMAEVLLKIRDVLACAVWQAVIFSWE